MVKRSDRDPEFDFCQEELDSDVSWLSCLSVQEFNKQALIEQLQDEIAQKLYNLPYDELPTLTACESVRSEARNHYDIQEMEIMYGRTI